MKRVILIATIIITCAGGLFAQSTNSSVDATGAVASNAALGNKGKAVKVDSGSRVAAQLQNAIDVRKARVGDQVVLKTTEAIKSGGQKVVDKGALLRGRVTDVHRNARETGESSISMIFDRLEKGSLVMPITATISSITRASGGANTNDDRFGADAGSMTSTSSRSSRQTRSSGGLLGGTTGTVGSVLNSTTGAVGGVVNTTGETVGNTTNGVGRTVSGIRISQPVSASASGESTLSLTGDNLRLEKGTSFRLALDQVISTDTVQ